MTDTAAAHSSTRTDRLLVGAVIVFAALAASFPARNSDLWMHLAAGRLIATGGYTFGVDPFSFTAGDAYWANHAWLTDLIGYGVFSAFGGGGLVALKALGVAVLAGLTIRSGRRPGAPAWVAAGCAVLAVLATAPRLLLQPACVSLVLLGLTLAVLRAGGRAVYFLPAVMALWVNLDGWFFLGPVTVGLVALGQRLSPDAAVPRVPGWLVAASSAACLLGPHHVRALVPPPELSPAVWGGAFRDDPRLAGFFASPWRLAQYGRTGGYSPAAWAYLVLLGLGATSFAANRRAVAGWRGLVWLAFAGLSAWQVRLVPFFAVVAGPITALNLADIPALGRFGRAGWLLTAGGVVALGLMTWPGWLTGLNARDRALGWSVESDPTLARLAADLAEPGEGDRVFTAHPDVAHYLAWHAPGARGVLDSRFHLFTGVAAEHLGVSRSLGLVPAGGPGVPAAAGTPAFDRAVIYDPDPRTVGRAVAALVRAGGWAPSRVAGAAVVVTPAGRLDERIGSGSADAEFPPTPAAGPELPTPAAWWDLASGRLRPRAWETDAAGTFLQLAEVFPSGPPADLGLTLVAARAARRGLALHPDSDDAWLAAARAFRGLERSEAPAEGIFAPLAEVRRVQTAAALVQAAGINPGAAAAHDGLAAVYAEQGFLDLALRHRREALRLARRAGADPDEAAAAALEARVLDNENRYLVRTAGLSGDPLARATAAAELGLAGKALDVLLESHPDLYGPGGVRLLLELLLKAGRVADARVLLDRPELAANPAAIGMAEFPAGPAGRYPLPASDWFNILQMAGSGRYDLAEGVLDRLRGRLAAEEAALGPRLAAGLAVQLTAEVGLAAPPAGVLPRLRTARERERLAGLITQLRTFSAAQADLLTVAGVLELERGEAGAAAARLGLAEPLYARAGSHPSPGRAVAARYVSVARRHQDMR